MNEWEIVTDEDEPTPRRPMLPAKNFVAPIPEPKRYELTPPQPHELMQTPSVQQVVTMHTTHVDRAKGFALVTAILSVVVGVFAVVVAVTLLREPLILAVVLSYFFTWFVITWLVSFVWYQWTGPDGIAATQQVFGFRLLRKEQDFRHEYLRHQAGMPQRWEHRRKGRK